MVVVLALRILSFYRLSGEVTGVAARPMVLSALVEHYLSLVTGPMHSVLWALVIWNEAKFIFGLLDTILPIQCFLFRRHWGERTASRPLEHGFRFLMVFLLLHDLLILDQQ